MAFFNLTWLHSWTRATKMWNWRTRTSTTLLGWCLRWRHSTRSPTPYRSQWHHMPQPHSSTLATKQDAPFRRVWVELIALSRRKSCTGLLCFNGLFPRKHCVLKTVMCLLVEYVMLTLMGCLLQGMESAFRPINHAYVHSSASGSGDSCQKPELRTSDSNTDNSRPNTGCTHDEIQCLASPGSDSGSLTTGTIILPQVYHLLQEHTHW